ncbi:MAG: tRNA uridine-5-carboxymethylaminomethyl(34) synthesis GTPase MnmE [Desulfuromonadaceae bacterium]|nr:tRNA uridine-5-carboxymethylaminomethyl(34) synthesis GTPase MnmE [Desulfuromonadaceae bacterium]
MYPDSDTIIAPATAVGVGAITIIRLSGPHARAYLNACFTPYKNSKLISHRLTYGSIVDNAGGVLDHVMAVYMQGPASFTREDVVEVQCHANPYIVKQIIARFTALGARLAQPGEFTYRAFMNGRIDLAEAEAIAELIDAGSEASARIAVHHLEGSVSTLAHELREHLFQMLVVVEAYLDFPEDEVDNVHIDMLHESVDSVLTTTHALLHSFHTGRVLREGLSILILGKPNVGKSSLLNYLLGRDRAIVTEIPGTTRDFIEEHITLGHLPVKIIDTAGLRESADIVEQAGVKLALDRVRDVDLVLYVVDGSQLDISELNMHGLALNGTPSLLVVNKADKFDSSTLRIEREHVCISAATGEGIDTLKNKIESSFTLPENTDSNVITEQRHFDIFSCVQREVNDFKAGLAHSLPGEFLACHLRDAMSALGKITGETVPEDILNHIFSKFCVGK